VLEIQPLSGDCFTIRLPSGSLVSHAKADIALRIGVPEHQQLLLPRVEEGGAEGGAESDEPCILPNDHVLRNGYELALVVEEVCRWSVCSTDVKLSDDGRVATKEARGHTNELVTTDNVLYSGRHYWEVKIRKKVFNFYVGVTKPNLNLKAAHWDRLCSDGWFINAEDGGMNGNGQGYGEVSDEGEGGSMGSAHILRRML
jgi:hypothetical protein